MIDTYSKCFKKLKIGDSVVLKLIPYEEGQIRFRESFTFPIIGYHYGTPIVGTSQKILYDNHRFKTTKYYLAAPELLKWEYFMDLDSRNIQIERIIKGGAKFNASHLKR